MVQAGQTSPCYDADFYPFGGERDINSSCAQNYKFEGKERDAETNNDDFGARYYSSRLGRWLSADWSAAPAPVPYANLTNPQTLNLYAMVSDNPESFADLDGHCVPLGLGSCGQAPEMPHQHNNDPFDGNGAQESEEGLEEESIIYQYAQEEQKEKAQDQSSGCGWCQKLTNKIRGAGWKTDEQIAQEAINQGEPPNGEYSFVFGKSCPDCKYYPKEVVEAVDAHEDQHAKDEHTVAGFEKLFSKAGRRELEVNAFKAELGVEDRNIKALESKGSARTPTDEKSLTILRNMRDQANGVIQFPQVYIP